ncbi:uncharacterized protein P174DRAFT_437266 [Aspergillus novofumigatus IBT 16806]|uniref:Uncharacterized protein n=1 Tax=Aspergillus novofumigatus (strain IBT 16806) TaxID=1392255 RepID=A0A2I1CMI2_ASPN1|nr:uncharacterized protein P174DRAFT_437266 [Aspergillus novofumigatus IBT 16806]PKX98838.1 hypothetical protein P174DRAFT_437266 [Aspergillus novofumigatus IBT 16806]
MDSGTTGVPNVTSSDDPGVLHVCASNVLEQSPNSFFALFPMPNIYTVAPGILRLIASILHRNKSTVAIPCSQNERLIHSKSIPSELG